LITVLATDAFLALHLDEKEQDDDDALYLLSQEILRRSSASSIVPNPVDKQENLNRIPGDSIEAFLLKLEVLVDAGRRASEAEDEGIAGLAWADAFSFLMPLPEAQEMEMVDGATGTALMVLPEISIDVSDKRTGQHITTFRNEVPHVEKECKLRFRIINPEILPRFATVHWTVRNTGEEAAAIGDLGHRNLEASGIEATEYTSYLGRHFMDCVIKNNNAVLAVRRIPVRIALPRPLRNPPRPGWVRLRSIIRRR
jgi:hypothetical protein